MKNNYKIVAESEEDFKLIQDEINSLRKNVQSIVHRAEKKFSLIHVQLKDDYNENIKINLPKDCIYVEVEKQSIMASNKKFLFLMTKKENQKATINLI